MRPPNEKWAFLKAAALLHNLQPNQQAAW